MGVGLFKTFITTQIADVYTGDMSGTERRKEPSFYSLGR
jgi:hypothetical protein